MEPAERIEGNPPLLVNAAEIDEWHMTDCYARFIIFNSCDEPRQLALLNCNSSWEMWTRIEAQYLQRAADNKHLLHRDFLNLRYITSQSVDYSRANYHYHTL